MDRVHGFNTLKNGGNMIRIKNVKLKYGEDKNSLLDKACKKIRIQKENVESYSIFRESLDVRKKDNIFYIYTLDLKVKNESKILKANKNPDVTMAEYIKYEYPKADIKPNTRPIVVGFGPAGMFAALILAQTGFKPIVFERGRDADNRLKDIEKLRTEGILNPNSNVQFGEGGAGTFSDGKLNTRIKNPRSSKVMEEFVLNGAPEEILYAHNPHIGTDRLVGVVKNIRERIISLGGEIHFESCITDIKTENGKIKSVVVNNDKEIPCDDVILSVGHSARDTFEMLYKKDIKMIQKPFAMGARIEHKQSMINKSQYGDEKKAEYFGPAEYKLTYTASNKRGVYTFCMCPGGYVVPAASEENMSAVNGMSYYDRGGENANSALLVQIFPEDFGTDHPLGGMYMQRELEKKAFEMAGGGYKVPAQSVGDFLNKNSEPQFEHIKTTYKPDITLCDLDRLFPEYMTDAMREGIVAMGRKIKGFDSPDALLIAPESRSSSPVRIERNADNFFSVSAEGLYPCGEGAGYAGGIVSAAVDGISAAEMVVKRYNR